jgi:hypothetical protein
VSIDQKLRTLTDQYNLARDRLNRQQAARMSLTPAEFLAYDVRIREPGRTPLTPAELNRLRETCDPAIRHEMDLVRAAFLQQREELNEMRARAYAKHWGFKARLGRMFGCRGE